MFYLFDFILFLTSPQILRYGAFESPECMEVYYLTRAYNIKIFAKQKVRIKRVFCNLFAVFIKYFSVIWITNFNRNISFINLFPFLACTQITKMVIFSIEKLLPNSHKTTQKWLFCFRSNCWTYFNSTVQMIIIKCKIRVIFSLISCFCVHLFVHY